MLLTNDNKYNAQIVKERVKQLHKQKGIKKIEVGTLYVIPSDL